MPQLLQPYFKSLYQDAMGRAYQTAHEHILSNLHEASDKVLDCGAGSGGTFAKLAEASNLVASQYSGIEWDKSSAGAGASMGLDIKQGDLNAGLKFGDNAFACVYGLSVLEHLLFPCRYIKECQRVLRPGGKLVLLTPNISTYFTALLILLGKMPSSGPHPDSELLLKTEELFKVSSGSIKSDAESDMPMHRHLVVFSYRVLRDYLGILGFSNVQGYGFGHYPFPKFAQPMLEKLDPYHCHQMVFIATKPE